MFESTFALETSARRSPLLISFALQTATVAALIITPLYFIEQLSVMPAMPVPVYTPKLPHMKIVSVMREATTLSPRLTPPSFTRILQLPTSLAPLARTSPTITEADAPDGAIPIPGLPFDRPMAAPQIRVAPPAVAPKPEAKPPVAKPGPTRVGGDVQAAKLIYQVRPAYPPPAKQARIQGTVRLQAVIARDGSIQNLLLSSGHPLLVPSAMEAVRQWRYRPTTLNGETVEVLTQIDVNFTLN